MKELNEGFAQKTENLIETVHLHNPWFIPEFVRYSFSSAARCLEEGNLSRWISRYPELDKDPPEILTIGVVMAGNVPMAGLHDFICILMSGHRFKGRLSSKDDKLLPALSEILVHIEPELHHHIHLTNDKLKETDAIIATGSNNSGRYFEYYFGRQPNIIRRNRNSAAILTGKESPPDLKRLADDVFLYFGLGCRNVSKLFLPKAYDITSLLKNFEKYSFLGYHNKYANNYDYQKAVYLINRIPHSDTGFLLVRGNESLSSPIGCLHYEYYEDKGTLQERLEEEKDNIQCLVSEYVHISGSIKFGATQDPMLWDYADNIDTMEFLIKLVKT